MTPLLVVEDDLSGTMLSRGLRLERLVARGSMGSVYRGRQIDVGRDVAVKVLHAGFDLGDEAGEMFRDEIRAIGQIDHRNVVRIYYPDVTPSGRPYFVMELLEGRTLHQVAEEGPLPRPRAIALTCQLLEGLAAVHTAGRVHADVKPANTVLVSRDGDERVVLIDFGLSRLRRPDQPVEAMGGTRAYMAPEQRRDWKVDHRSDLYSAALVMVRLLTGWQAAGDDRVDGDGLAAAIRGIDDPALRIVLGRALADDPADRLASATDFVRALVGGDQEQPATPGPPPPFRHLAPLTEQDRGRLYGRDADVVLLARRLDHRGPVVFTAPSGTGKTSLLRAGLVPYLDATGVRAIYVTCRPGVRAALAAAIMPGASSIPDALVAWHGERGRQLVVILDQMETVLDGEAAELLADLLDREATPDVQVTAVLGIREDFVARLMAASPLLASGAPQVRLRPLDRDGARAALVGPLREHGVELEPELLEQLLDDLTRAGGELGAELGWGGEATIYPPHIQLTGAALHGTLGPQEDRITIDHYLGLGGFEAIVGEHVDRILGELSPADREVARALFLNLISAGGIRLEHTETDLVDVVGARHGEQQVRRVLDDLQRRGLAVRRSVAGAPSWELIHDSLVVRIERWLAVHDLDRQRAAEVVRFHLRQSQPDAPALLSRRELRDAETFPGLLDELEDEWTRRAGATWTPRRLAARSRQILRYRRGLVLGVTAAITAITALLVYRWLDERRSRRREEALRQAEAKLRDNDLGRFVLELEPFDWDDTRQVVVPTDAAALPDLRWEMYEPAGDDPDSPGRPVPSARLKRGQADVGAGLRREMVEARGGNAILEIHGRGRGGATCSPSLVKLVGLPGYARRGELPRPLRVRVPTCAASAAGMVEIPAGRFVAGGRGVPAATLPDDMLRPEAVVDLDRYWIDRTEVTNAAFAVFADMWQVHGVAASTYPAVLGDAGRPDYPRTDIDWFDARAYCRFLGKTLPTSPQWQKALRGGLELPGGPNPRPRRNLPWGDPIDPPPAQIATTVASPTGHPSPVGAHPADRSPFGVLDLAGNVQEWTLDPIEGTGDVSLVLRGRVSRGGNWSDTTADQLVNYLAIDNARSPRLRNFFHGLRCVTAPRAAAPSDSGPAHRDR